MGFALRTGVRTCALRICKLMTAVPAAMYTASVLAAAGVEAPAGSLAIWRARSIEVARAQGIDDFEPSYLKLANAGDRNAVVEVTGESSRSLGPLGSVALDANTGELLAKIGRAPV